MQSLGQTINTNKKDIYVISLNLKTIPNPPSWNNECFKDFNTVNKLKHLIDLWKMFLTIKTNKQNTIIKQQYIFSILELQNRKKEYDNCNR